jgi:hypothetical protein
MNTTLTYFTKQGIISDPGGYATLFDGLPRDLAELVQAVQGSTLHIFWAERYGLKLSPEREAEVQLRTMPRRLGRMLEIDLRPLSQPRPLEKKLVGNCRDFTLLLISLLRHQGVPARARCGFGAYFLPGHFEDHWVAEVWDAEEQRWRLVDAQLDAIQCEALKISFDPLDVPREQFITGGKAWQMCRSGQADPQSFGIFDMHGLGFVRGDFVRDVAALNKAELLPWDCWGIIEKERLDDPDDLAMLDGLAELTAGEVPEFERVQARYNSDARLRMDGTVTSYTGSGPQIIHVAGDS